MKGHQQLHNHCQGGLSLNAMVPREECPRGSSVLLWAHLALEVDLLAAQCCYKKLQTLDSKMTMIEKMFQQATCS